MVLVFIAGVLVGAALVAVFAIAYSATLSGPTLADQEIKRGSRILRIIDKEKGSES